MLKIIGKGGRKLTFETLPGGKVKRNSNRRGGEKMIRFRRELTMSEYRGRRPIGIKRQPIRVEVTHLAAATCVAHDDNFVICLRDMNGDRETVRIPRECEILAHAA